MTELTVRPAVPDDADAIGGIHVRGWQHAYIGLVEQGHLDGLDVERRSSWWRGILTTPPFEGQRTWVAERRGVVEAFATAGHTRDEDDDPLRTGELQAIYVEPKRWRSGAGSTLMIAVVGYLVDRGFEDATLWVLTGNAMARRFYEKHGWASDGVEKNVVWDGVAMDEIRYRRALASGR